MSRDRFVWALRLIWAVQPVTTGSVLALGLETTSRTFAITASSGLWILWAACLGFMLIPLPITLVAMRSITPAAPMCVVAAVFAIDNPSNAVFVIVAGIVAATIAAALAMSARVGDRFVDGASYGDERRMLLRPSMVIAAGPMIIAWILVASGLSAGPMLIASRHWWWGAAAMIIGIPTAAVAFRALYFLTQRWIVFVPAGIVLRDATTLADPVLFRREGIADLGPALSTTSATDLTAGAPGLALEMQLVAETALPIRPGNASRSEALPPTSVDAILFTPSLPGSVLDEAARRGIVGR